MKIVIITFILFVLTNFANAEIIENWRDARAYKPFPIILSHGFAQGDASSWQKNKKNQISVSEKLGEYYTPYRISPTRPMVLQNTQYPYLEILSFIENENNIQEIVDRNSSIDTFQKGDYYVAKKLRKAGDPGWADKLAIAVDKVLLAYNSKKVILVAHSMGGLAAREYITNPKYTNAPKKVARLITLGTPHSGSFWVSIVDAIDIVQMIGHWLNLPDYIHLKERVEQVDGLTTTLLYIDLDGDAISDMSVLSPFLNRLNSCTPCYDDVNYFAIAGKAFLFKGDGVVSLDSQKGTNVLRMTAERVIKADHASEISLSISGKEPLYSPLIEFIDSTTPEFELNEPVIVPGENGVGETIKLSKSSLKLKGKVYKEYLPANSVVVVDYVKIIDGKEGPHSSREFLLSPSDLWNPDNPDSPVAEFDAQVDFPGEGLYGLDIRISNPANKSSKSINFSVDVRYQETMRIFPEQAKSDLGAYCGGLSVSEAEYQARSGNTEWESFLVGQTAAKFEETYNGETKAYYRVGLHRSFLSFDTSILQNKEIVSAQLVMFCNDVSFDNRGEPFYLRVYAGQWPELINSFSDKNEFSDLVSVRDTRTILFNSYEYFQIPPEKINDTGKTQIRLCSDREEDRIVPAEPILGGGNCSDIDNTHMLRELVDWNPLWIYLEVSVNAEDPVMP